MIVSIYLEEHEYLTDKPQTINFGGRYLYSFLPKGKDLIVERKSNEKYIPNFYNISESRCKVELLSAVVGQNGVGKSSILDVIRKGFVDNIHSIPYSTSTILVEIDGKTKFLQSNYQNIYISHSNDNNPIHKKIESFSKKNYQSIYYSPHFDLKYNSNFDEVDKYDCNW